ncbi:DNA helicase [Vibrio phage JSF15]|uniref:DNA helicase n=1 Tax=Vibrio phage JSF15 TaxID=1983598 RepID=A0A2D0YYQ7_9CAUD|nr:DNA helicase [Vibrio phage JSF15]
MKIEPRNVFRYPDGISPMEHQTQAMRKAWNKTEFALFMEMGTGKTFTTIALAGHRFNQRQIDGVLVIVPTPIKPVWEWEVRDMSPVPSIAHVHDSGGDKETMRFIESEHEDKLKYLVIGVEALSQGKAHELALAFVRKHNALVVVDESSRIKNADAARTKKAIRCGDSAAYRMILTGTPITQGIIDLFGQFRFLGEHIIGLKSFFVFRNMYCIMGGFQGKKVLGYQREEELMDKIAPYVYQVKKTECLDLPEKVYRSITVSPTKEQLSAMKELKDFFETEQDGDVLTVSTVLDRMTRFQQILGGNFPFLDKDGAYDVKPISGPNPKMDAMLEDIADLDRNAKVIIWARFRAEIEQISKRLREVYGDDSVIEYHGGISESDRKASIPRFQDSSDPSRFFVANQQTAGMGITLTVATFAYYYSNSFSLEQRLQSEDRNHRKGQRNVCTYIDIWCKADADLMVGRALKSKKDLAVLVDEELQRRIATTRRAT